MALRLAADADDEERKMASDEYVGECGLPSINSIANG